MEYFYVSENELLCRSWKNSKRNKWLRFWCSGSRFDLCGCNKNQEWLYYWWKNRNHPFNKSDDYSIVLCPCGKLYTRIRKKTKIAELKINLRFEIMRLRLKLMLLYNVCKGELTFEQWKKFAFPRKK